MKKKNVLLILAIAFICVSNSFARDYPSGALLWKVSGNGLEKTSYILGTFHMKTGEYLAEIPGALDAIDKSEQIVGELDMTDVMKMQQELMPAMMMGADTTYAILYSEEEYQFVSEKLMSILGVSLDQMKMLKPAALQTTIVALMFQKLIPDFDAANALDVAIQQIGQKEGKPIQGLETVQDQAQVLFNGPSLLRQAESLLCSLEHLDETIDQAATKLLKDYENADLNSLYFESFREETTPCQSTESEKDDLLKNRNEKWLKKLPDMMKDKSSFIAVGALHLAGEEGL
ncbi:TraB/GumN family protein, partial [Bacteroidales bacterium OttesenSCG-928-A17]|nr:TraB/GumN family protein [Bacteroidales bacterium OttesenSCG-928-A17]